jgi:N-acetylmuramoyl-L-alanine amidase
MRFLLFLSLLTLGALLAPSAFAAGPFGSVSGRTIVIDPGHNPNDSKYPNEVNRPVDYGLGTKPCDAIGTATRSGYAESRYTYDVSLRLRAMLQAAGARVILTHTLTSPAFGPCIVERAQIGNRARADVAISIHADGGPDSGHGYAAIAPSGPIPHTGLTTAMVAADVRLAAALRAVYPQATGIAPSTYLGSNGIYRSNYYGGLDWSHVPKVLLETGNMRNDAEARRLETASVRQRIARGIALGLARFLSE